MAEDTESMYPSEAPEMPAKNDKEPDAADKDETTEGETALLPKSLFMGQDLKPGDTVTLKIVHGYQDEIEVCPVSDKEDAKDSEPEMSKSMSGLDEMTGQDEMPA